MKKFESAEPVAVMAKSVKFQMTDRVVVLTGIGFLAFLAFWFYDNVLEPPHKHLQEGRSDGNYRQLKKPTPFQIASGRAALSRWKGSRGRQRARLADDLILSDVLLGLTQKEIVAYLGPPDAFGALRDVNPDIRETGYDVADGESQCDLMIDLKDQGRASDVYLHINR